MSNGQDEAMRLFEQCLNKRVCDVRLGHGSFLTMDFGETQINTEVKTKQGIRTSARGEWHLWIYMCAWRLEHLGVGCIGANDDREEIIKEISRLERKRLCKVSIVNQSFDLLLEFEEGFALRTFSYNMKEDEQWMLFTPLQEVYTAGPGSEWEIEASSQTK